MRGAPHSGSADSRHVLANTAVVPCLRKGGDCRPLAKTGDYHWQIAIVLGLFVCLATVYSLVLPLGEAADETDHFALVRFIAEHSHPPLTIEERNAIGPKGDASPVYHALAALLTQHVDVLSLSSLPETQARPERFIPTDGFRSNRILHTEDEMLPFRGIVLAWHLARLVSVPLGAATVVAAYVTALSIFPRRRDFAVGVAAVVAFLPRFIISSAVVSDDSLVVPLVAFSLYVMVRVAQGDRRRSTLLVLGALIGLAAITKYHSLVLVFEMTVLVIVLAWRASCQAQDRGRVWLAWLGRWAWVMLAFVLVAGWWFVFLVIRFNQVAELGWGRGLMSPLGDPVVTSGLGRVFAAQAGGAPDYGFGWSDWASLFFRSFWLAYAWLHIFAPGEVYLALAVITVLAALGLCGSLERTLSDILERFGGRATIESSICPLAKTGDYRWRPGTALLALHFLAYLGIVAMRYWLRPARETAQGRHLYPALTAVAFFFVLGLINAPGMVRRLLARRRGPGDWNVLGMRPPSNDADFPLAKTGDYRGQRDVLLPLGVAGALLVLSLVALPIIILPEYVPYLPVRTGKPEDVAMSHHMPVMFAEGLHFEGYDLPAVPAAGDMGRSAITAGEGLPVTLYWYAGTRQQRDYLVQLCLSDGDGRAVLCHYGHPVNGRYPMRAWETGYLIRDEVTLPTPDCTPTGEYVLTMALLPLRLDMATTDVDQTVEQRRPVSLGRVALVAAADHEQQGSGVVWWTQGGRREGGKIELRQIRQSLVGVVYRTPVGRNQVAGSPVDLEFSRLGEPSVRWLAALPVTSYQCATGVIAEAYSFVLDPGVRPGQYAPALDGQVDNKLTADVLTRWRDYSPPVEGFDRLEAAFTPAGDMEGAPYLTLVGYDVDLHDPAESAQDYRSLRSGGKCAGLPSARSPGDSILLTGYWQSQRTMSRHYVVSLYLLDNLKRVGGQVDWSLGAHYPNVLWAPGEYVGETYALPIKPETPAGLYTIELSLYDNVMPDVPATAADRNGPPGTVAFLRATTLGSQEATEHIFLEQVRVRDPAEGTPPSHPLLVDLGGQIQLLGYDLTPLSRGERAGLAGPPSAESSSPLRKQGTTADRAAPGQMMNLVLQWRAVEPPKSDYTVFTQLVGPDGLVWGQQDNQPQGGRYPTTSWAVGQPVVDRYDLVLRPDAPAGQYQLLTGMYELETGQRLSAVAADGTRLPADAIPLTTLTVE